MPDWFVVWYRGHERGEQRFGSQQSAERKAQELRSAGFQAFAVKEPGPEDFTSAPAARADQPTYPTTRRLASRPPRAILVNAAKIPHVIRAQGREEVVAFKLIKDANYYRRKLKTRYKVCRIAPKAWPTLLQRLREQGMQWIYLVEKMTDTTHQGITYRIEDPT